MLIIGWPMLSDIPANMLRKIHIQVLIWIVFVMCSSGLKKKITQSTNIRINYEKCNRYRIESKIQASPVTSHRH